MNPRTILWQTVTTTIILVLLTAIGAAWIALAIALLGMLGALALNAQYATVLGTQGRTRRRIAGDRVVAAEWATAFGAPLVVAAVSIVGGWEPHVHIWRFGETALAALLTIGGTFGLIVMLSSLTDWYYIRPRLDGVVWDPPCRAKTKHEKARWKRVTRRWYIHRGIAALSYFGFALGVAAVVIVVLAEHAPAIAGAIGGISGIASFLLFLAGTYRTEIPIVVKWSQSPAFYLGDEIEYWTHGQRRRAYVLHVAVPVVKLVPIEDGQPTDRVTEPKNSQIAAAEVERYPSSLCDGGCRGLNPECLHAISAKSVRCVDKRRHLILR